LIFQDGIINSAIVDRGEPEHQTNGRDVPVIVWLRRDLRLADNPALCAAVDTGKPVIVLYIYETDSARPLGAASQWWLYYSLYALGQDLAQIGGSLILRKGQAKAVLEAVIHESGADCVLWNRRYSEDARKRDGAIKDILSARGLTVTSFRAALLTEPWTVKTKTGGYYKVFTPYWRAARAHISDHPPLACPVKIRRAAPLASDDIASWSLRPYAPDWGQKFAPHWQPGQAGAARALTRFLAGPVETYITDRDRPDKDRATSHLSPHLAFGEISPRQIWHACSGDKDKAEKFLTEIGWREFAYVLLFHNPALAVQNFKPHFDRFHWQGDDVSLAQWQNGLTGYPFVDAGMRQLWQTGWQHNRVRMVTASFLIKHLLIDWRYGERWFWDTLVDADPASNAAGWQWVAGSGADASPYFRIFNPVTQGEKFDPEGLYIRRYIPELSHLPNKYIHRPWEAPQNILDYAGVTLGKTYPHPIVDHKMARARALAAYKDCRKDE